MHGKNKDTKALVVKTTRHEKDGEKSIIILERWILKGPRLVKQYLYTGDSFDSAANLFDHYKKRGSNEGDIVCLRIIQLVITEFIQTMRVDEIAVWIAKSAETFGKYSDEIKSFLENMEGIPLNYFLGYGSRKE